MEWQIRSTFGAGCAGIFVFAWTDEWHRGGFDIDDWGFGLTDRDRKPKRSLAAVRKAFAEVPFARGEKWPSISVVVCSYNGARTIRETLEGLRRLEYPDYEVIVVDDGSTDATPDIAREYDVRLISGPNRGLSHARNVGLHAARGEIIAYIDDDAWPDPHWLTYLAAAFRRGGRLFYVGAGTSGRLGALDASECPPTFSVPSEMVQAILAGGDQALGRAQEGAEDDAAAGADAVHRRGVGARDVVVGIAASGRTPFVWGALGAARGLGAATVLVCFNPTLVFDRGTRPTLVIAPRIGPEILTGSTRLKAGTATKLLLNIFSTISMV
jgi:hypothetical protein